jgi:HEAT repeat protein
MTTMPRENLRRNNFLNLSLMVPGNSAFFAATGPNPNFVDTGAPPLVPLVDTSLCRPSASARNFLLWLFFCLSFVFAAPLSGPCQVIPGSGTQTSAQRADIPDLLQKLLKPDAQTRADAYRSLGAISPEVKIPALIQALSDPDWKIQVVAAYHLGQMGSAAREAIPALATALDSLNPDVRFVITKALEQIGSQAAVPPLARALQDKDENVRLAAAMALDNLGPDARAALPVLQKYLRDGNWFVRSHAAKAFVWLAARDKSMLPVLLKGAQNPLQEREVSTPAEREFQRRRQEEIPAAVAIDALAEIGPDVAPLLIESLRNEVSDSYQTNVTFALVIIGSKTGNEAVVDQLIQLLQDHDELLRHNAALALGLIGSKAAIPSLVNPPLTEEKLKALGQIGLKIILGKNIVLDEAQVSNGMWKNVFPSLSPALRDPDWRVRAIAAAALGTKLYHYQEKQFSEKIVASLTGALQDKDWQVRSTAIAVLGRSRFPLEEKSRRKLARKKGAVLNMVLKDEDWRVRCAAVAVIPEIYRDQSSNQDQSVTLLNSAFNDDNVQVRRSAIQAIQPPIHDPGRLTPMLSNFLADQNPEIRMDAAIKLLKLGNPSELAETILVHTLQHHQDSRCRLDALDSVRHSRSDITTSAIIRALQDHSIEVRCAAAEILGKRFGANKASLLNNKEAAVKALINGAHNKNISVRRCAVIALSEIGSPNAVPALTAALDDPDLVVRYKAGWALGKIKSVVQEVEKNLLSDDWQVRRDAFENLRRFGIKISDSLLPIVLEALHDQNSMVRASAAKILVYQLFKFYGSSDSKEVRDIAQAFQLAIPDLIDSLNNGDSQAQLNVLKVLPVLGPTAQSAIPALNHALANENWQVRYWAARALIQINPPGAEVVPVFAEIFHDPRRVELLEINDRDVHYHHDLDALSKIDSSQSMAVLINLLKMQDEFFRYTHYLPGEGDSSAAEYLTKLDPLMNILQNENGRFLASDTLGRIGPKAIPSLMAIIKIKDRFEPALSGLFLDHNADLRRSAVYSLGKIGERNRTQKNAIVELLAWIMNDKRENLEVRWLAALTLIKLGKNVDAFFAARNLSKPVDNTWIDPGGAWVAYEINLLRCYFDLYADRFLLAEIREKGGSFEVFSMVHKLLSDLRSKGAAIPQPQPASTTR